MLFQALSCSGLHFFTVRHRSISHRTPNDLLNVKIILSSAGEYHFFIRSVTTCAVEEMSEPPGSDPGPRRSAQEVRSTTETASQPGLRHLGATKLRARTGDQFTETMNDYLDTFQELQISTMFQPAFWTSIIYRYRQGTRHLPFLRRGTEASIKNMSDDILRGYGGRVWGADSGWRSNLAAGEEMLLYDKDGPNDE